MNTSSIIENIILAALPFIGLLAAYLYKILINRMPSNVHMILQQLAPIAVHAVEQMYDNANGMQKKDLAIRTVVQLLTAARLPTPSTDDIEIAVEHAVLLMNQMPQIAANKEDYNPLAKPLPNDK